MSDKITLKVQWCVALISHFVTTFHYNLYSSGAIAFLALKPEPLWPRAVSLW